MQKIHIGNPIKKELERQERTISWFARKLSCDRSNIYKLFRRHSIDSEMLLRISLILHRNFFEDYSAYYVSGLEIVDEPTETAELNFNSEM